MAKYMCIIVGCVLLNTVLDAIPLETILNDHASEDGPKLNDKPYGIAETVQDVTANKNGQREKRFYNYFDYNNDFNFNSDFSIPFGQSINKRQPFQSFGNYGDLERNIQNKIQEIASATWDRAYLPPPPITLPYLTFIPFIYPYVPKVTCECTPCNVPSNNIPLPTDNKPMKDNFPEQPIDNSQAPNKTVPELPSRFPEMDDINQSWMSSDNNSENDYGDDESEGARPISFNPIKPEEPLSKPPPPFEHGSVQAGIEPEKPNESPVAPVEPSQMNELSNFILSSCEKAAVSCCHQPRPTYECLKSQGCVDSSFLRNSCSPDVLLKALRKFEYFYRQKLYEDS